MKKLKAYCVAYFKAMSQTYFFENAYFGVALIAVLLAYKPQFFILGLLASLYGFVYTLLYSTPKSLKDWGLIPINCFFFGIAMESHFQKSPVFYLFLLVGVVSIPLITKAVFEVLQHWKLSPFIIPYIISVWVVAMAGRGTGLEAQPHLWSEGVSIAISANSAWSPALRTLNSILQGMGRLLFQPNPYLGMAILILVTAFSPRRGVFFLLGTALATGISYGMTSGSQAWEFGYFSFSAGLVGLGLASFLDKFKFTTILFFCTISAVITVAADQWLKVSGLPLLSLPYVVTLWFGFLSRLPKLSLSWVPASAGANHPRMVSLPEISQVSKPELKKVVAK